MTLRPLSTLARPIVQPTIVVHGGAWAIPDKVAEASLLGVAAAADAGHAHLHMSALDAVEAAVRALENNPVFNAGVGASLNAAGEVELDAVVMDGRTLSSGAVAAIGAVSHPVSVARQVMEQTDHVLLVGNGATAFAREIGVPILDASDLVTEEVRTPSQCEIATSLTSSDPLSLSPSQPGENRVAGDLGIWDERQHSVQHREAGRAGSTGVARHSRCCRH